MTKRRKKEKFTSWWLFVLLGLVIVVIFTFDFGHFGETDEERNIRGAKEWLESYYEILYFDDNDDSEPINMPLARMKEKGDRATQVTTGFDALTRAYPAGELYTVTIVGASQTCIYGLTSEEWKILEMTTYGNVEEASLTECY